MNNVLSIDLEDWYQTEQLGVGTADWDGMEGRLQVGTNRILDLLDQHAVKATFFILGYEAKRNPGLVREIVSRGHEVGCHGYWHKPVFRQTRREFRDDLKASHQLIEDVTGQRVTFYRAPSWSISRKTLWALEELVEQGFTCDSSIQPFWTPLSGIQGAPVDPYQPIVNGRKLPLLEFPPTTVGMGSLRFPFAGGFYVRVVPFWLSNLALRSVNANRPGMVYIHPWELDLELPRLGPRGFSHLHHLNMNTTFPKLQGLLNNFQFAPLSEVIAGLSFPALPV